MLSVQREIAREITNNLRPTLSGVEMSRMEKQYTANAEAFQLYLKGRFYWNKRTGPDLRRAVPFFEQAIEKDPNYALAYTGMADTYALIAVYKNEPARAVMPKAKEAALKALALDDNLAEAHASLGQISDYYDYDFVTAEREYRRAIELNPNYASAHQWLAEHLCALRRNDEALAEVRRALELDPMSVIINRTYGDVLTDGRKFDEAIQQYQKTLALDPNFPTGHYFLARAYEAKGSYDEAVKEYAASSQLDPVLAGTMDKATEVYKKSGWKAYVQFNLEQLVENAPNRRFPAFVIATFYAKAGRTDEVIKWLEKGYEERDFRMTKLSGAFEFDGLRSDPRFRELVRRMGLPE
jgi:tetratricopeptide (TPR) repeat protein